MFVMIIVKVGLIATSSNKAEISQTYVAEGKLHNEGVVEVTNLTISGTLLILLLSRCVLLCFSYKNLQVCRAYIHLECFDLAIGMLLPVEQDSNTRGIFYIQLLWFMTTLYCNDFWRVCISVLVPMASYEIMNVVHYDHN